jgi:hypothetical protein
MIKQEDSSSMYDFMSADHEAPIAEPLVREVNWQSSNNERFKRDLPDHVKESMKVTQKDLSYYAFSRFAFGHPVVDNFESTVNKAYKQKIGELEKGFIFIVEREKYIKFYRELMGSM